MQAQLGVSVPPYHIVHPRMEPIPDDIFLPHGWACRCIQDDEIEFVRDDEQLSLLATRSDECPRIPALDLNLRWEVTCEQPIGEAICRRSLGYATTQARALNTLLSYMGRINGARKDGIDTIDAVLDDLAAQTADPSSLDGPKRTPNQL